MKTLEEWEKTKLDLLDFIKNGDEIDWGIYEHIICCVCAPNYQDDTFAQCGEASFERNGTYYYMTVKNENHKYYYIGELADMNKRKPKVSVKQNVSVIPKLKIGDPVLVADPGLLMLQRFKPKNAMPNNYGRVSEIWDDGNILVEFPIGKNYSHSQVAPYPKNLVVLREFDKKFKI